MPGKSFNIPLKEGDTIWFGDISGYERLCSVFERIGPFNPNIMRKYIRDIKPAHNCIIIRKVEKVLSGGIIHNDKNYTDTTYTVDYIEALAIIHS